MLSQFFFLYFGENWTLGLSVTVRVRLIGSILLSWYKKKLHSRKEVHDRDGSHALLWTLAHLSYGAVTWPHFSHKAVSFPAPGALSGLGILYIGAHCLVCTTLLTEKNPKSIL